MNDSAIANPCTSYGPIQPQTTTQLPGPVTPQDLYVSANGELTKEREQSIKDACNYLDGIGFPEYLSGMTDEPIYLDGSLEENVLGKTECGISEEDVYCRVLLKPQIYDNSFKNMEDGSPEYLRAKYDQVHALAHELHHKHFMESQKGISVLEALEELGYSQNEIAGVVEMVTEHELAGMYAELGAKDMAWMARRNTPYRKQLERAYHIDRTYKGGLNNFLDDLSSGLADVSTVETYMGGIGVSGQNYSSCDSCFCPGCKD